MKVLIVAPNYPPTPGGVERHVQEIATALVRRGHVVTVLALLEGLKQGRVRAADTRAGDGAGRSRLNVIRVPMFRVGPFDIPRGLIPRLRQLAADHDVVHVHNYHSTLPMLTLGAIRDTPVVVNPHFHGGGHSLAASLVHPVYRSVFKALLPRASGLAFVSSAEKRTFEASFGAGPGPGPVIHNGIRIPAGIESPGADQVPAAGTATTPGTPTAQAPLIVSVGRLESYKRVETLLAALPLVPGDWRLTVVGDGPDRPRLEAITESMDESVARRIRFAGRVSDAELDDLLAEADVAVTASEHESFGMAALDAMAAGARVIASDIPAHRELSGLGGANLRLWDPASGPDGLAQLIGRALAAGQRLGPVTTKLPTWDDAALALEALYGQLVPSASSGRDTGFGEQQAAG